MAGYIVGAVFRQQRKRQSNVWKKYISLLSHYRNYRKQTLTNFYKISATRGIIFLLAPSNIHLLYFDKMQAINVTIPQSAKTPENCSPTKLGEAWNAIDDVSYFIFYIVKVIGDNN